MSTEAPAGDLSARLEAIGDPRAEALVGELMEMYGEGLARVFAVLDDEQLARLAEDGVVASLMLLHGHYPVDLETRVGDALALVRPYMESHGGGVELVSLEGGVAKLRLLGGCDGCPASASTLEHAIMRALEEHAPDLAGVELDGLDELPEHVASETGCELCGHDLPDDHKHLLHLEERRILCVCGTCWSVRSGDPEFRPAGNRTLWLDDVRITDEQWAGFQIPIGLAFFMVSTVADGVVALYPSPAGATESELELDAWERVCAANPVLAGLEPDTEALIVDRMAERPRQVIVPIDVAYELVGTVKASWEGITGGPRMRSAVEDFFEGLR